MPKYVLDFGPAISGNVSFTIFRDITDGTDYLSSAPTLDTLVSGWTQFEWTSGVNVHFRAEKDNNTWIAGTLSQAQVLPIGDGSVRVDHDYGGTDNLRVLSSDDQTAVDNAFVTFYLTEDYNAGNTNRSFFAKAWTYTLNDGRFENPVYLDPGNYTVLVTGSLITATTKTITVT